MESVEKWAVGLLAAAWAACIGLGTYIWRGQTQEIKELKERMDTKANKDSTDKRFDEILDLMRTHAKTTDTLSGSISQIRADVAYLRGRSERANK